MFLDGPVVIPPADEHVAIGVLASRSRAGGRSSSSMVRGSRPTSSYDGVVNPGGFAANFGFRAASTGPRLTPHFAVFRHRVQYQRSMGGRLASRRSFDPALDTSGSLTL